MTSSGGAAAQEVVAARYLRTGEQVKGGGNANHNQPTLTCTGSQTGVLGDFLNPGETPPPGTSVSDPVTFTLTVIAVPHS
jgi:hypothetical protein